jgi:hypothetical protein
VAILEITIRSFSLCESSFSSFDCSVNESDETSVGLFVVFNTLFNDTVSGVGASLGCDESVDESGME